VLSCITIQNKLFLGSNDSVPFFAPAIVLLSPLFSSFVEEDLVMRHLPADLRLRAGMCSPSAWTPFEKSNSSIVIATAKPIV
jgi:hypothetical protein